jgi:hypothetical protein
MSIKCTVTVIAARTDLFHVGGMQRENDRRTTRQNLLAKSYFMA